MLGFITKHPFKSILAVTLGATAAVFFAFALPVIFAGTISTAAIAVATSGISLAVTALVYGVGRLFDFLFCKEREVRYLIDNLKTSETLLEISSHDYVDNDNDDNYIEDDYIISKREPTSTNRQIPERPVVETDTVDETENVKGTTLGMSP